MKGTELRSLSHFQILTWIACLALAEILKNLLILKFVLPHYKSVKASQNNQIWI